jgi:predicted N-acetyltransferase YhbS
MRIDSLANHRALVPAIAKLLNQEWGALPPWASLSEIEQRLGRHANIGRAPFTLVALGEGDEFLGTASVKLFELPEHPDKAHWLGEVFVSSQLRGQGVGSALIRACIAECERLQIPALYLYTPDQQALYAKLGWEEIERSQVNGESVSIMRKTLRCDPAIVT